MFLNRILQARIAKILQRSFVQTISEWVSRKRSQYYYRHIRMLAMLASSLMENCCSDLSDSVSTIHSNSYTRKIISFANKVETEMIIKLRLAYDSNTYSRSKRKKKYPSIGAISILIPRVNDGAASSTIAKKPIADHGVSLVRFLSRYPFISVHRWRNKHYNAALYYRMDRHGNCTFCHNNRRHEGQFTGRSRATINDHFQRTFVGDECYPQMRAWCTDVVSEKENESCNRKRVRKGKRGGLEGKRNLHAWRYIVPPLPLLFPLCAPSKIPKQTPLFREYRRRCASRETTIPAHVSSCPRPAL